MCMVELCQNSVAAMPMPGNAHKPWSMNLTSWCHLRPCPITMDLSGNLGPWLNTGTITGSDLLISLRYCKAGLCSLCPTSPVVSWLPIHCGTTPLLLFHDYPTDLKVLTAPAFSNSHFCQASSLLSIVITAYYYHNISHNTDGTIHKINGHTCPWPVSPLMSQDIGWYTGWHLTGWC